MHTIDARTFRTILAVIGLVGAGWFFASLTARETPRAITLRSESAPVTVPAKTRPVDMQRVVMTAVNAGSTIIIPEDGWIVAFRQSVRGAPESSARFTFVYDNTERDPYCPNFSRTVFVMSLEKTEDADFPHGHGYFVKKGTTISIGSGLANFTDADYPAVSVTAELDFVPSSWGKALSNAYPLFLNAECNYSLFAIPPHTVRLEKWLPRSFEIPIDGRITTLGSHAHKNALEIYLTLNGKELWRTTPIHLPDGTNLGNPYYKAPFNGVPVKKGDTLNLRTTYTNPGDKPGDAMSSMYIQILTGEPSIPPLHNH